MIDICLHSFTIEIIIILYQNRERRREGERENKREFRLQIDLSISAMQQGKLSGLFKYDM